MPKYEYIARIGGKPFTKNTLRILKLLLENGRLGPRELAEKVGISHSSVVYALKDKIEPLGKFVLFINPEKIGMKAALVRVRPEPKELEEAVAHLTLSPLVRFIGIDPNKDEIWLFISAPEWKLREFRHRLRTTPHIREYEIIPLNLRKFDQPIPPEMLDELVRVAGGGE